MTYEERLQQQAEQSLDITERVLSGNEVSDDQRKTALAILSTREKNAAARNRGIVNVISLVKHVRDVSVRETVALGALRAILPNPDVLASGQVMPKEPLPLAAQAAQ